MRRISILVLVMLLGQASLSAQELFIHNAPASVLPKGAWTVRTMTNLYREDGYTRLWQGLEVMYGVSKSFEVGLTMGISNHNHPSLVSELFNEDDPNHDHSGHQHGIGGTDAATGNPEHVHPMQFTGARLYSQFKFLNLDGPNRHLRMASYHIISANRTAHNFSEPNLLHRNAGLGAGLIMTGLYKKAAASLRVGGILPFGYREKSPNRYFRSGRAIEYALSLGYLLYPRSYRSYRQLNLNLYMEFMGKVHTESVIYEGTTRHLPYRFPELTIGRYLELRPGIQAILGSRYRLSLSTALPIWRRSWIMEYPQLQVNFLWLILR